MNNNEMIRVSNLLGGTIETARRLGVAHPTVSQWRTGAARVPMARARQLQHLLGADVDIESLTRPASRVRARAHEELMRSLY